MVLAGHLSDQDYSLDKSNIPVHNLRMDNNSHFFLGLGWAFMDCRKSLLMEASNFRVGTFFSSSFLPFSTRGSR